jgi:hypothetical protein
MNEVRVFDVVPAMPERLAQAYEKERAGCDVARGARCHNVSGV